MKKADKYIYSIIFLRITDILYIGEKPKNSQLIARLINGFYYQPKNVSYKNNAVVSSTDEGINKYRQRLLDAISGLEPLVENKKVNNPNKREDAPKKGGATINLRLD